MQDCMSLNIFLYWLKVTELKQTFKTTFTLDM